ncbi:3'-5' exoribonuclease [Anaerobacillus sp. HL2]|nr:3'-5' exoribonuclease [Anaerobacillus sp. HL2]
MKNKFVVIDVETTKQSQKGDRIIQIGAVIVEQGKITDKFSSYVNPDTTISSFIQQFTGITNEMVEEAPTFSSIAPIIMGYLNEAHFVAHNVPFDLSFLQNELDF